MREGPQYIYELQIQSVPLNEIDIPTLSESSYFSNLKKAVEMVNSMLVINNWESTISYSSVYRDINELGFYKKLYQRERVKYFRVVITRKILNPRLTSLGIPKNPL
jgi:hypothetical protein